MLRLRPSILCVTRAQCRLTRVYHAPTTTIIPDYLTTLIGADFAAPKNLPLRSLTTSIYKQHASPSLPARSQVVVVPVEDKGEPKQVTHIKSVPLAEPLSHELTVKIIAAAINPIDTMLCQGYGREITSIASSVGDTHKAFLTRLAHPHSSHIALGREAVGTVAKLGEGVWDIHMNARVWLTPPVTQSAIAEYATLARNQLSLAPKSLNDIEAATYPFTAATAWAALVDCAGIVPTPLTPESHSKRSPWNFVQAIGIDPDQLASAVDWVRRIPPISFVDQMVNVRLTADSPKCAVVHGASGQVGLIAIQLLQYWGWEVYATTLSSTRASLDALAAKMKPNPSAPLHIIATDEQSLSSVVQQRSISVFVDGVGGDRTFREALPLLARSAQFVTLRGEGVKKTDERGLIKGAFEGGAQLLQYKAEAAKHGTNFHWVVSMPSEEALEYTRTLIDRGIMHTNLLPIEVWHGISAAPDAIQAAKDDGMARPPRARRHVVVIGAAARGQSKTTSQSMAGSPSGSRSFSTSARSNPNGKAGPPYRLALFASSPFSIPALRALKAHAHSLLHDGKCTVITPADKPTGRGQIVTESEFKKEALKAGFDVLQLPIDIDFKMTGWTLPEHLRGNVDVGVVVSFGYMLPASVISQFPQGVINIHPSILPRYRGSSPIQFAIALGDQETGVSIIDVHPTELDGGNIIKQVVTPLPRDATFESLSPLLANQGAAELIGVLQDLSAAQKYSKPQIDGASMTTEAPSTAIVVDPRAAAPRIPKSAGEILFAVYPPETLFRIWAALQGFSPSFTKFNGQRVIVHGMLHPEEAKSRLSVAPTQSTLPVSYHPTFDEAQSIGVGGLFFDPRLQSLGVICASSTPNEPHVLYITDLQLAGKNPVSASQFALGYLDKRKITTTEQRQKWRFTSPTVEIVDFWSGKL